ncbi:MAG: hypothetical protein IH899_03085 [Planctomycetes bacterium]|nr:hypothetical protein [Planctomycetota bacterium]
MQTKRHIAPFVVMALLFFSTLARAETLQVPKQYATIQACIDAAAKGDECVVAPGTYNEAIDFLGKAITLRSSHGADVTIIDGGGVTHVVQCVNAEDPDTVFDGFTITGGNANGSFLDAFGGGMLNIDSSPTVTDCTFSGNMAKRGGGMYNTDGSSPTVTDCTFSGNTATDWGGAMFNFRSGSTVSHCTFSENNAQDGGGMYNYESSPAVTGCMFSGNTARQGGGMYNLDHSPTVTDCTFSENEAAVDGGGMYNTGGGGATVINCTFIANTAGYLGGGMFNIYGGNPTVTNCTFSGNRAASGGGMHNFGGFGTNPTVTNCMFNGNEAASDGGGMFSFNSSPTVANCTFSGNQARDGGGMYNIVSSPTVTNCTFSENEAASEGGAVYNSDSSPTIGNCAFIDNVAVFGGAMANRGDSSPLISHCRFQENFAHRFAGAMFNFFQNGALVHVVDSEFLDNHAELNGGAVTNDRNMPLFNRCIFRGNSSGGNAGAVANFDVLEALFMNCVFNSNVAGGSGSAIENSDSDPLIVNCTFTGNRAGNDGAVWNIFESRPALWNCILWNNSDRSGMIEASQITDALDGNAAINHSCVQGLTGSLGGEGNIGTDPRFVSRLGKDGLAGTEDDDLRLLAGSPAIDAGDHEFVPEGITTDLDGNPRFVDDPAAPDTGVGDAPIVDMGAYEFQVDCDGNGLDDDEEIAADPTLDCDDNGKLDACEEDRDEDGDGVIDDCDECSDSSADETIVINGCETRVVNQVFNDGCTMADDLAACGEEVRNHGAYVSCVARVANSWQRDGMISDGEHGRVVSCAAKQHTGRNLGGAAHWKKEPDPQK